jgi:uncharacterized protein
MYEVPETLASPRSASTPARTMPKGLSRGLTSYGEVHFRDQYFPLDYKHGRYKLEAALACDHELLERLGPGLTREHIRNAAFLDIETAGTSEGPSSHAFMVGIGTFEGLWFRVRQYFLADPLAERAMLTGVTETIERCAAVVTFNGRSFDLPQLANRFALARMSDPLADLPHIDLLHPARLLFAGDLDSCRLAEIEDQLLKFRRREDDVPGALIPCVYATYLRRRNPHGLHPIFEHNSHDVVSLVAFIAYLNRAAGGGVSGSAAHHRRLGKWDEQRGRTAEALENHRRAWAGDAHGHDGGEAILRLTHTLMAVEAWQECVELWRRELAQTNRVSRRVRACIELAKLYERQMHDPVGARRLCVEGLAAIEQAPSPRSFVRSMEDLETRIARLEARVSRGKHITSQ